MFQRSTSPVARAASASVAAVLLLSSLAANAAPPRCPSTQTGSLNAVSTAQTTARLLLDGKVSACGTTKAFPGSNSSATVRYETFSYENRSTSEACVNVSVTATSGEVETAAYLGTFQTATYLGDPGASASANVGSTTPTQSYAINVQPLKTFLVMVQETTLGAGAAFSLAVTNCGAIVTAGVSPAFGPVAGGETVTLSGTGFTAGATATVGGVPLTNVTVGGDGSLTGTTGAHAAGEVDVVVTDSDGTQSTLAGGYTYMTPAPSSVTASASPTSAVFGQPVYLSATLAGTNPPATFDGTVTFEEGTSPVATPVTVTANGTAAALPTSSLSVGTHAITAAYGGGTLFEPSTSSPVSVVVSKAQTQTAVLSSVAMPDLGQAVTFTSTVSPVSPGSGTPTGTVQFVENGALLGEATLDSTGTATWSTNALPFGNQTVYADYQGDPNFKQSTGSLAQTVGPGIPGETLTSSAPSTAVYGTPITFTASFAELEDAGVPQGYVTFTIDQIVQGNPELDATGTATLLASVSQLSVGQHSIGATYYSTDLTYQSASMQLSQTITPAPTTTSLTTSLDPGYVNSEIVLTAMVTGVDGGLSPTGTVTFSDTTTNQGGEQVALVNGRATWALSESATGSYSFIAFYSADTNYQSSQSAALVENIVSRGAMGDDGGTDAGSTTGGNDSGADDDAGRDAGGGGPDAGDAMAPSAPETGDSGDQDAEPSASDASLSGANCGCRAVGGAPAGSFAWLGLAAAIGALGRRRRRRVGVARATPLRPSRSRESPVHGSVAILSPSPLPQSTLR